jgi:hypothetical protein
MHSWDDVASEEEAPTILSALGQNAEEERPDNGGRLSDEELVVMLKEYLLRNPYRWGEKPSWFANTLWCELEMPKPSVKDLAWALHEMRVDRASLIPGAWKKCERGELIWPESH